MKFLKDYMFMYRKVKRKLVDAKSLLCLFNDFIILLYSLVINDYEIRISRNNRKLVLRLTNETNGEDLSLTSVMKDVKDHRGNKLLILSLFDDLMDNAHSVKNKYFADKIKFPQELLKEMEDFSISDLDELLRSHVSIPNSN